MQDQALGGADGTPGKASASLEPPLDADPAGDEALLNPLHKKSEGFTFSPDEKTPRSEEGDGAYDCSPAPKFKGGPAPEMTGLWLVSLSTLYHSYT